MITQKLSERISKEDFFKYLNESRKVNTILESIYDASNGNLDLINFDDVLTKPLRIIEKNFFSNVELDYISWYLYEFNQDKMKVYENDCRTVIANILTDEDLWEFLNRDNMRCWEHYTEKPTDNTICFKEFFNEVK